MYQRDRYCSLVLFENRPIYAKKWLDQKLFEEMDLKHIAIYVFSKISDDIPEKYKERSERDFKR